MYIINWDSCSYKPCNSFVAAAVIPLRKQSSLVKFCLEVWESVCCVSHHVSPCLCVSVSWLVQTRVSWVQICLCPPARWLWPRLPAQTRSAVEPWSASVPSQTSPERTTGRRRSPSSPSSLTTSCGAATLQNLSRWGSQTRRRKTERLWCLMG